jgi:hypothetical protein
VDTNVDGNFSEITIHPDGRVYVFGLTAPLLEVLADLPTRERCWQELHAEKRCQEPFVRSTLRAVPAKGS